MKMFCILGLLISTLSAFGATKKSPCQVTVERQMRNQLRSTRGAPIIVDNIKVGSLVSEEIVTVAYTANLVDLNAKKIKTIAGSARFIESSCQPEQAKFTAAIEVE